MKIQFCTLFTINITHSYYGGDCKDFDFVIPADAAQLMRNGKMTARVSGSGLRVLFASDENNDPLSQTAGQTLRFGLKLLNPYFSNFTKPDAKLQGKTRVYRNGANPQAFDAAQPFTLVGPLFSHALTGPARPVTVTLQDPQDRAVQTDTIAAANDRGTVSYDLTGLDPGAYTVQEAFPGEVKNPYYVDAELQQLGVFGVLEIVLAPEIYAAAKGDKPPEFTIAFAAQEEFLKYYLIARNYSQAELAQLSVKDNGAGDDERSPVNFNPPLAGDAFTKDEIPAAILSPPDNMVVLFKSEKQIPRQEKARKKIQLLKNGTALIPHLPQVGADKVNGDIVIQISK